MEKLRPHKTTVEYLCQNNSFTPILSAKVLTAEFGTVATALPLPGDDIESAWQ